MMGCGARFWLAHFESICVKAFSEEGLEIFGSLDAVDINV
jgi:hypothetical protein